MHFKAVENWSNIWIYRLYYLRSNYEKKKSSISGEKQPLWSYSSPKSIYRRHWRKKLACCCYVFPLHSASINKCYIRDINIFNYKSSKLDSPCSAATWLHGTEQSLLHIFISILFFLIVKRTLDYEPSISFILMLA